MLQLSSLFIVDYSQKMYDAMNISGLNPVNVVRNTANWFANKTNAIGSFFVRGVISSW